VTAQPMTFSKKGKIGAILCFIITISTISGFLILRKNTLKTPRKWTFMFYLDGDNDLERDMIMNVNDLEIVGSNPYINLVVQLDRSPNNENIIEKSGNWTDTRRAFITKD